MGLIDLLPEYYQHSPEVVEIQSVLQEWSDLLSDSRDDLLLQLAVNTATWGLALWEKAYGIPTDISKSIEYRRTKLKSRIRGLGTATVAMIQNVANSFDNGSVDVIEHADTYSIEIEFTSVRGVPPNLQDLKNTLSAVVPAHLAISYTYNYILWSELDAEGLTFDQLDALALTMDEFEGGDWI